MTKQGFSYFAFLPAELRFKIWSLNLPGPRIVTISYTPATSDNGAWERHRVLRGCTSSTSLPSNLHTSRESRVHALRTYHLSFNLMHGLKKVFFNWETDILYFGPKDTPLDCWRQFVYVVTMVDQADLKRVRRLAVSEDCFLSLDRGYGDMIWTRLEEFWKYVRRRFLKVEEVIFVLRDAKGDLFGGGQILAESDVIKSRAPRIICDAHLVTEGEAPEISDDLVISWTLNGVWSAASKRPFV